MRFLTKEYMRVAYSLMALVVFFLPASGFAEQTKSLELIDSLVEEIANPVIEDRRDLRRLKELCNSLPDIETEDKTVQAKLDRLHNIAAHLSREFLSLEYEPLRNIFLVAWPDLTQIEKQNLTNMMLDAYARIRNIFCDSIGVGPPLGFIFVVIPLLETDFVKTFSEMGREKVGAFIQYGRWIVVPLKKHKPGLGGEYYRLFYNHFEHELVHAFVNTNIGVKPTMGLPKWFHEMVAVSFGEAETPITTPDISLKVSISREYQEYFHLAQYLRGKFGSDAYYQFVRTTMERKSADAGLEDVFGYDSYESLREEWRNALNRKRTRTIILVVGIVAIFVVLWGMMSTIRRKRRTREFGILLQQARTHFGARRWADARTVYEKLQAGRYDFLRDPKIDRETEQHLDEIDEKESEDSYWSWTTTGL